jgi:formiminotetrahydrofolate cyclodeaminase
MKLFRNYSLSEYTRVLSLKVPAPGGGSAAALIGAVGAALLSMAANYSLGKGSSMQAEKRIKDILKQTERLRKRFLELVDLDTQAYLRVVQSRQASPQKKKAAVKTARQVPQEVCRLCYKAVQLCPDLVRHGNKYLLSDVEVALQALQAAFNSAKINVEINQ